MRQVDGGYQLRTESPTVHKRRSIFSVNTGMPENKFSEMLVCVDLVPGTGIEPVRWFYPSDGF